jgi:hypothetical protein
VIENLDRPNTLLAGVKLDNASHELFWSDPFSEAGANTAAKALPATHDLRLSAEHAAESLMRNRSKAHLHPETLDDMLLAAWHLDTLGLKIQFTSEISRFYWDAYQNQADGTRAQHDLDEIVDINGRLESSARCHYADARACTRRAGRARTNPTGWTTFWCAMTIWRRRWKRRLLWCRQRNGSIGTAKRCPLRSRLGFFLK